MVHTCIHARFTQGSEATAGGWIRAFGRDLTPSSTDDDAPPRALVRAFEALGASASGYNTHAQLEKLKELFTGHPEWLTGAPRAPSTTLTLTPVGKNAHVGGKRASPTVLVASAASTYSAEFQIPEGLAAGE